MSEPILTLTRVSKTFEDAPGERLRALSDISIDVRSGEFFVFVGPSGSGKSTILRIMSGLEKSYEGNLELLEGVKHSDCGFVFQQFALLPWLTVFENVEIGLTARGIPERERRERVTQELRLLGLDTFSSARPHELSGGMRQRVGIARALVTRPKLLFMDEPFSELDSFTAEELRKEILRIWGEKKLTVVMVTHIVEEAIELADRIAVLTARPGKIEKIVPNSLPRPRDTRSKAFFDLEDELYRLIRPGRR